MMTEINQAFEQLMVVLTTELARFANKFDQPYNLDDVFNCVRENLDRDSHTNAVDDDLNIESEVLDPIQTHPAQPHLTNPESALEAHVKDLLDMSPQDKNILRASLTLAHRAKLSPERKAAVNIDCVMPIVQDSGTPYGEETVQRFRSEDGTQEFAIVNRRQEDRWYAVFKGRGFTGVVRGKEKYDEYVTSGVSGANGKKARNRAEAEFNWLVMYYKGQTGPL